MDLVALWYLDQPVFELLLQAVPKHDLTSRVQSDEGCKNQDVAAFMVSERAMDHNSNITHRSVHNHKQIIYQC